MSAEAKGRKKKKKKVRRRGRVVIDAERCKGCGLCLHFCRRSVLAPAGKFNRRGLEYVVIAADRAPECNACASCALMCPDTAIEIYLREEAGDGG